MTMVWPISSTSPAPSSAMTASVSTTCFTQTTMFISSLSPVYGLLRVILRKVFTRNTTTPPLLSAPYGRIFLSVPKWHKAPIVRNGTDQGFLGVIGSSYALIRDVLSLGARLAPATNGRQSAARPSDRIYWAACSSA